MSQGSFLGTEPKPNGRCYFSIILAMIGAMMFGIDCGNFGNIQGFRDFTQEWCEDRYGNSTTCAVDHGAIGGAADNSKFQENFVSWANSMITFGAATGALSLGPVVAQRGGRRLCISAGAAICFGACLFASYLSFSSVAVFMTARFFTGFGIGMCEFALVMYNAELATPGIRGRTGSIFQFFVVMGLTFAVFFTTFFEDWKLGVFLPGVPGAIVMVVIWVCPESPRFLMQSRNFDAGVAELKKVRANEDVMKEAESMWQNIMLEKETGSMPWLEMFSNGNLRKRVIVATLVMVFQRFTGVNFFIQYASTVFTKLGLRNPLLTNCITRVFAVTGICTGMYLMDYDGKLGGRRPTFLMSSAVCSMSMMVAAISTAADLPGIITIVAVCVYSFGFALGWGPGPWVYVSEMFVMRERDRATGLAVAVGYGSNSLVVSLCPYLTAWSLAGAFWLFASFNLCFVAFNYCCMPETKGVPLEDVPGLFDRVHKVEGARSISSSSLRCSKLLSLS